MYLWLAVAKTYCYIVTNNFMLALMILFHIRKLAEVLLIENYHISLPEACILDYYVAGFWYPLSFCIESEKVCSLAAMANCYKNVFRIGMLPIILLCMQPSKMPGKVFLIMFQHCWQLEKSNESINFILIKKTL